MIPNNLPQKSYIKGLWRFEATSGTVVQDFSNNNHPGTASRTQILGGAAGRIGNCGTFVAASSDKVTITDHADLKPTGNFSISAWIKTSTTGTTKIIFQSFSLIDDKIAGIMFRINTDNVLELWSGKNTGNVKGTDYDYAVGTTNVCDNVLHHAVGHWDGGSLRVYVDDGVAEGTLAWVNAPVYGTTFIRIGCQHNVGTTDVNFMNGIIDELILWNGVALSQAEVLRIKNIGYYQYGGGFMPFFM